MDKQIDRLINNISKYKYVSFDIFDTVIFRNVSKPSDIFEIVEKKLIAQYGKKMDKFAKMRVQAEQRAIKSTKNAEVTFNEIYSKLEIEEPIDINKLKFLEEETEILYTIQNPFFVPVFEYCIKNSIKIILISDIYLPESAIKRILEKNSIKYDLLYLSSSVQKRKSTGQMFEHVLRDLDIHRNELIHIGDNWISDYCSPLLKGIKAMHYASKRGKSEGNDLADSIVSATIENSFINPKKFYYETGFKCLGPALLGFCQWLHSEFTKERFDTIWFFARDGKIVKDVYDRLYSSETFYFFGSRRSLTVPRLVNAKNFIDIYSIVPYIKRIEPFHDLLYKIGIEDNTLCQQLVVKYGDSISRDELLGDKGNEIFGLIKDKMYENADTERKTAMKYIESNVSGKKIAVVDVGWYGTMQESISNLITNFLGKDKYEVKGYYFGLLTKKNSHVKIGNAKGYVYTGEEKEPYDSSFVFGFNGLIETFFSANHGSTKKYRNSNGVMEPVLERFESENIQIITDVHEGALDFISNVKSLIGSFEYNVKYAYKNLERLLTKPRYSEVIKFSEIVFYDAYYQRLVQCKGMVYYIIHPKQLLKDFMNSNWKIGFLKQLFKIPLNFGNMYKLLQRMK